VNALLRARLAPDLDADDTDAPLPTAAELRAERVAALAARIASGKSLWPGQRLTPAARRELADVDYDRAGNPVTPAGELEAAQDAKPKRKAGRPPLDDGKRPLAQALNRDRRELLARLARRYAGGPIPVPAWVGSHRAEDWRALVRQAARSAGR
jgi:hypothetical protein